MCKLSESIERKFTDSIPIVEWEIETDSGWEDITAIHKTIEYEEWEIETENGLSLIGADTHILFDENYNEVFIKDLIPTISKIKTKFGNSIVSKVYNRSQSSNMYDITVNSPDHRFYSNDILSHNTTTALCILLHYVLFNDYKVVALLANKERTVKGILSRIKTAYEALPKWLQHGVKEWNKASIWLENESKIIAGSTSSSSIRSESISFLYIDECVTGDTIITVRDKMTGEIKDISIETLCNSDLGIKALNGEKMYKDIENLDDVMPMKLRPFLPSTFSFD